MVIALKLFKVELEADDPNIIMSAIMKKVVHGLSSGGWDWEVREWNLISFHHGFMLHSCWPCPFSSSSLHWNVASAESPSLTAHLTLCFPTLYPFSHHPFTSIPAISTIYSYHVYSFVYCVFYSRCKPPESRDHLVHNCLSSA